MLAEDPLEIELHFLWSAIIILDEANYPYPPLAYINEVWFFNAIWLCLFVVLVFADTLPWLLYTPYIAPVRDVISFNKLFIENFNVDDFMLLAEFVAEL